MYYTRYKFHKDIYNHKAVKSIELMVSDILLQSNTIYNYPSILDTDEFNELDDNIISRIKYNNIKELNKCRSIINRIQSRDLYSLIYKTNCDNIDHVKDIILDKNLDKREFDYHFIKTNFDFCNNNDNPLKNVKFYKKNIKFENFSDISCMNIFPNNCFKESIIYVYEK